MFKRMHLIAALAILGLCTAHQSVSDPAPAAKKEIPPEPEVEITAKDAHQRLEQIKTALDNHRALADTIHKKSNL